MTTRTLPPTKACNRCKQVFAREEFPVNHQYKGSTYYRAFCKDCYNIRQREAYLKAKPRVRKATAAASAISTAMFNIARKPSCASASSTLPPTE